MTSRELLAAIQTEIDRHKWGMVPVDAAVKRLQSGCVTCGIVLNSSDAYQAHLRNAVLPRVFAKHFPRPKG
jgi:hypothetical protein